MKMKLYFAHPMCTYNTIIEEFYLEMLTINYGEDYEIVNPNQKIHQDACDLLGDNSMSYFEGLTKSCDALVAMSFPDKTLGAGIAKEIEWMWEKNGDIWIHSISAFVSPILLYKKNDFDVFTVLTREETRAKMLSYQYGTYKRKV
jgi:hypothetical protein